MLNFLRKNLKVTAKDCRKMQKDWIKSRKEELKEVANDISKKCLAHAEISKTEEFGIKVKDYPELETNEDIKVLKDYLQSAGFKVKYNYDEPSELSLVIMWNDFKPSKT